MNIAARSLNQKRQTGTLDRLRRGPTRFGASANPAVLENVETGGLGREPLGHR
jgi:hypothetical protein